MTDLDRLALYADTVAVYADWACARMGDPVYLAHCARTWAATAYRLNLRGPEAQRLYARVDACVRRVDLLTAEQEP